MFPPLLNAASGCRQKTQLMFAETNLTCSADCAQVAAHLFRESRTRCSQCAAVLVRNLSISLLLNADIMDGTCMNLSGASQPPVQLPAHFASLSSIAHSQNEIEPVDLVCSEDTSSLGGLRSFRHVPRDVDIDPANHANITNFCLGNSGEFLHKVILHLGCLRIISHLPPISPSPPSFRTCSNRTLTPRPSRSGLRTAAATYLQHLAIISAVTSVTGRSVTTDSTFLHLSLAYVAEPEVRICSKCNTAVKVLDISKSKDGQPAVAEFMSSLNAQV